MEQIEFVLFEIFQNRTFCPLKSTPSPTPNTIPMIRPHSPEVHPGNHMHQQF